MSVGLFLRRHRNRAVAYLVTIRDQQQRKFYMGVLRDLKAVQQLAAANATAIAALQHPETGAASVTDVTTLGDRVTAVEDILGSVDERNEALTPPANDGADAASQAA